MTAPQGHLPVPPKACSHLRCSAPVEWWLYAGAQVEPWGFCAAHRVEHMRFEQSTKSWREAFAEGRARWEQAG